MPEDKYKNNYQIRCVANTIRKKEADGEDATFERDLLKAWAKYPGWEYAKTALENIYKYPLLAVGLKSDEVKE